MNLPRTASVAFAARLGRGVVGLITLGVFIHALGAEAYGSFVLFEGLLALVGMAVNFGIGGAVQKRVSEGRHDAVISTAAVLEGVVLLFVALVTGYFAPAINGYVGVALAGILPLAIAARQVLQLSLHVLRGRLRVAEAAVLQFGVETLFIPVGYILVSLGHGVEGLAVGFVVTRIFGAAIAIVRARPKPALPTLSQANSLIKFSKHNYVASVLGGSAYSWVDTLILGLFVTPELVTAYETAWRISMAVALLSKAIGTALFPQVSHWVSEGGRERIAGAVEWGVVGALVPVFPALVGTWILAESLLVVPFGPSVAVAAPVLVILVAGKLPEAVNDVVARTLFGLDKPAWPAIAAAVFLVLNVSLNFFLVPRFELIGAAIATVLSFFINSAINAAALYRLVEMEISWFQLGWSCVAALGMGLILGGILPIVETNTATGLTAVVATGIVVYVLLLVANPTFRRQGMAFVSRI